MSSTAKELFDAALRQYAKHKSGKYVSTLYICVPHQLPPVIKDSDFDPPEADGEMPDQYVAGDHDCRSVMRLVDGLTYQGHQAIQVRSLAERTLQDFLPDHWQEEVLCRLYSGQPMWNPDFRNLSRDLRWDVLWPEVDRDKCLTGKVVGEEEGYVSVFNEAMMREDVAREAGLTIEDGCVYSEEDR